MRNKQKKRIKYGNQNNRFQDLKEIEIKQRNRFEWKKQKIKK